MIRRQSSRALVTALFCLGAFGGPARADDPGDLRSDTWVATDALGRSLPGHFECGPPRAGRFVGIFYFLWLGQHGTIGPYDITRILAANPDSPQWGPLYAFHHWHESELGYYLSNDAYVIRRHASMLADAGIDVMVFDVTNGFTYKDNYLLVCGVFSQIRQAGGRTPQIAFLANSDSAAVVQTIYNDFYSKNLYPDLWFFWDGKPLMMASPEGVPAGIQNFFTFRQSWAWSNPNGWFGNGQDKWPWLDNHPQNYGWHTPGVPEEVSVCVAQHPTTNIGRSSVSQVQPPPSQWKTTEGPCFAQQWERALSIDPQFIFVTGWNEWVAQRFVSDGTNWFLGKRLPSGETYFVDAYTQEYSRDIEPMKGGHTDNYYYQMIANIRRFKGVRAPEAPSPAKTIVIDGQFSDWTDVTPEYRDTVGDTAARLHPGWGSAGVYTNTTGRNDIVAAQVARDAGFIYFHVRTQAPLTPHADPNWMLLFIDADLDHNTGWNGYDYLVNSPTQTPSLTTVKRSTGGWNWSTVATASFAAAGNQLELRIPRAVIGQNQSPDATFDFHWADNIQQPGDIIEFAVSGDSAPNRRFNYRYNSDFTPPEAISDLAATRTQTQLVVSWTNPSSPDLDRSIVRFRTDRYPINPADGTLLCERGAAPGAVESCIQPDLDRAASYYYAAFSYDRMHNGSPAALALSPPLCIADMDADLDVDQSDFALLQQCLNGTAVQYIGMDCALADFDGDDDVDFADVRRFIQCVTGANQPADPACGR